MRTSTRWFSSGPPARLRISGRSRLGAETILWEGTRSKRPSGGVSYKLEPKTERKPTPVFLRSAIDQNAIDRSRPV